MLEPSEKDPDSRAVTTNPREQAKAIPSAWYAYYSLVISARIIYINNLPNEHSILGEVRHTNAQNQKHQMRSFLIFQGKISEKKWTERGKKLWW